VREIRNEEGVGFAAHLPDPLERGALAEDLISIRTASLAAAIPQDRLP